MHYRLRVSGWTRRITLRVTAEGGLEVVVPRRTSRRAIAECLAENREWIRCTTAEMQSLRLAMPPVLPPAPPAGVALPALAADWTVCLRATGHSGIRVRESGPGVLDLCGAVGDPGLCCRALQRWLLVQGRRHLPPWLEDVSRRHGLSYTRSAVRLARSRWGSCTRGAISLNARLLLLSPTLVDYVLVHELCHTIAPNHSPAFWGLVAQHCPDYLQRRRVLRVAGKSLPAWADGTGLK